MEPGRSFKFPGRCIRSSGQTTRSYKRCLRLELLDRIGLGKTARLSPPKNWKVYNR